MRTATRISLALAGSAALVASMALPASAADTTTTVAVPAGTIGVSAVPTSADLGSIVPGTTASVVLTGVQISDQRAGVTGWVASVSMSTLNGSIETVAGTPDYTISAVNATYTGAAAVESGTVTVTSAGAQADLSTAKSVQTATAVSGNNTATWDGTLALAVPSDAKADTYTAVLTHSVL